MSSDATRILIVSSDDIAADTGTGITLRNLFHDWPEDRLAQVHLSESAGSSQVRRVRYPPGAVPADHLVRRLTRGRRIGLVDGAPRIAAVPLDGTASRPAVRHAAVRAALDLSPMLPSRAVDSFISDFRPQVIYSLLGSVRVTRLAARIASSRNVGLVPHFMDDWPSTLYSSGELRGAARSRLDLHLRRALALSPVALCISQQMCDEYGSRFGVTCHPFVNPVHVPDVTDLPQPGCDLEFLYVGGLHLGRWDTLMLVGQAIRAFGGSTKLVVYAPAGHLASVAVPAELADHVVIGGSLTPEEVPDRLRSADVLVHAESFDDATQRYVRLSLSTKVPQYLASGRPIFAIGPAGLASLDVVEQSRGGLVVTSQDPSILEEAVRQLASSRNERAELAAAGREYALTNFSEEAVRQSLREVLTLVADG